MSQDRYFDKFPVIKYGNSSVNTAIVDITKRADILNNISSNPYIFYPYDIAEYERADQFSYRYYDDPYKSWLLYITNKVIDPYYEWYMKNDEFDTFIIKKYGSISAASTKIIFYRTNLETNNTLTVSGYNALTAIMKTYWQPVYGVNNKIISYEKSNKDRVINTNKIVAYNVANTNFIKDEICHIVFDNNNKGKGQVCSTGNNVIYLQHISGTYLSNNTVTINSNSYIFGSESSVNTSFSNNTLVTNNIHTEVEIYWEPVTYYQYETEKNEFNKTVRVLDNRLSKTVAKNLKDIMKEP